MDRSVGLVRVALTAAGAESTDGRSMQFQASDTLKSRSYVSLIVAQFLAAFNDQAIHIVAIFYAGDLLLRYVHMRGMDEKAIISIVTACFISPFLFFSTLAGMLADKYSKRTTLVFWKVAEVGMMALALAGFLLPHLAGGDPATAKSLAQWSAFLVVSVVFMMGTHSAFFVPAKYGVMPEILQPTVLSKGNGILEGTSFVAQILGTTCGALLYTRVHSTPNGAVLELGSEWLIGVLLLALAIIGAVVSLFIARMPAASPERKLTWKLWQPLAQNLRVMLRSRPLGLAALGIAFFLFITLFARQTLLYQGETEKDYQTARREQARQQAAAAVDPEDDEADTGMVMEPKGASEAQTAEIRVAILIALIGLGVGIGSPLAGALSGNKVELGLVPIGALFLIFFTAAMSVLIQWKWPTRIGLVMVGVAASFYIVPLYTLLQHRAPKDSKGNLVATSNFINVAGGLLAVAVFLLVTFGVEVVFSLARGSRDANATDAAKLAENVRELEQKLQIPKILFVVLSVMIAGMLLLLCRKLPDFFVRALLWLRSHGRYRLKVVGQQNLPTDGPVILATNCDHFESCMQVVTATDRYTRFILLEGDDDEQPPWLLRYLARRTGLIALPRHKTDVAAWGKALAKAGKTLAQGHLLGVTADGDVPDPRIIELLDELRAQYRAPIIPVYCGALDRAPRHPAVIRRMQVVIGHQLREGATPGEIRQAIHLLGEWMHQTEQAGLAAATVLIPGAADAAPTAPVSDHPARP
jgi:acyl-[acyl-carrier-protein]-phospholipid O-acyltransferase/long-chain-fatty-acid--[acyl-carrier-protein] ligase